MSNKRITMIIDSSNKRVMRLVYISVAVLIATFLCLIADGIREVNYSKRASSYCIDNGYPELKNFDGDYFCGNGRDQLFLVPDKILKGE